MTKIYWSLLGFLFWLSPRLVQGQMDAQERVYLHLSSQDLICGETLYYSAYCLGDDSQKASLLSKILYVEIIGEDGVIHQNKVALDRGRSQGELFVPSTTSTGQYQIVAYTRWMRNFDQYFSAPLIIVNPFEVYRRQKEELKTKASVTFYPNTGKVIAEVSNLLYYKIAGDRQLSPENYQLKVVSKDGDLITESTTDRYGLGQFEWTPKAGQSYSAILEDSLGQFEFFELPPIEKSGTVVRVKKRESFYEIDIQTAPLQNQIGVLSVRSNSDTLLTKQVALQSVHLEAQGSIIGDKVTIEVLDDSGHLLSKTFLVNNDIGFGDLNGEIQSQYHTRQKVSIESKLASGTYSISVLKKRETKSSTHTYAVASKWANKTYDFVIDPIDYLSTSLHSSQPNLVMLEDKVGPSDIITSYIPEFRDEFVDGQLLDDVGRPVSDALVAISLPYDPPQIRISSTNQDGSFSIPFESSRSESKAFISYFGSASDYQLTLTDPFATPQVDLGTRPVILDSVQVQELMERSIRNQIENAFYKPNSTGASTNDWQPTVPFTEEYILDDYTRFRSIKETFIEYITAANVRDNREQKFKVQLMTPVSGPDYPPLLLLNGVPVDQEEILAFSPFKIKKIAVLNQRFYSGPLTADGVISFTTKERNLGGFKLNSRYISSQIIGVAGNKVYHFPQYKEDDSSTRPDQRDQLYWDSNIVVKNDELLHLEFYTSDVEGTFEIFIEGFTHLGEAVSLVDSFEVRKE